MTHRIDGARGRDISARWCLLAEQRLEYLTELFETGRWRRYHNERAFLENIQEAKAAVDIWRGLATREASPVNSIAAVSWLGVQTADDPVYSPQFEVSMAAETDHVCSDEAPSAPLSDEPALNDSLAQMLNPDAIGERYPLLRNAL
jgi:uncharacterized repeat protein (TIGR03809 family)